MKIGFVSQALPYLPSRGGFRLYGGNLIRRLSRRHRVDLISLLEGDDEQHLDWAQEYCASVTTIPTNGKSLPARAVNFFSSYLWAKPLHYRWQLASLLETGLHTYDWDVLHVEGGYAGGLVPPRLPLAKVLSLHDSWTLRCEEMLKCTQGFQEKVCYTLWKHQEPRYERLLYPRYEAVTLVAERDASAVRATVPDANVILIPYGTDTEYFHPVKVAKEEATLVFHSHLGYAPNVEAALEFVNDILPRIRREIPNATFHLVGADPAPKIQALASRPGIKLSANLPDLRRAVCSARIYVCAIRRGTGLKSKMLEAMAMQMPIVAYHPGSTVGIDCVYGRDLLAAESAQEFAAHVVNLLKHPERARDIAQAGRKLVEERYSWESRARAYEELYHQIIDRRKRANGGVSAARQS